MKAFKNRLVERLRIAPLPSDLTNDIDIQRRFLVPLVHRLVKETASPRVYAHPWNHKESCHPNCSEGSGLVESPQLHGCPQLLGVHQALGSNERLRSRRLRLGSGKRGATASWLRRSWSLMRLAERNTPSMSCFQFGTDAAMRRWYIQRPLRCALSKRVRSTHRTLSKCFKRIVSRQW